jgi:hypothetical protein
MGKKIKITENQLKKLVENKNKKAIQENDGGGETNYMFFSNLEQLHRQTKLLMELDPDKVNETLNNGHDWADDHVTVAKENLSQVFDFMMNEFKGSGEEEHDPFYDREEEINYGAEEDEMEPKDNGIMNESVQKIKNQFKRFF